MKTRIALFSTLIATLVGMSGALAQDSYQAPRTEWGQPDLQGVWNFASNTPMQRPAQYGEREFLTAEEIAAIDARVAAAAAAGNEVEPDEELANREAPPVTGNPGGYNDFWIEQAGIGQARRTSHIIYPRNGRLPPMVEGTPVGRGGLGPDIPGTRPVRYTVGGIAKDGPEDRGLSERCIVGFNSGPPFGPSMYNNNVQIFQSKDTAVILTEMIHDARTVPLDEKPYAPDEVRMWSGDSRGFWDGDTLVVVTKNFNGLMASYSGMGTGYDKVLTERFTRVAYDTVNYEWTIEDPSTFTDKITAIVPMTKVAGQLYEYACHEGNYGMKNILRGQRMEESRGADSVTSR